MRPVSRRTPALLLPVWITLLGCSPNTQTSQSMNQGDAQGSAEVMTDRGSGDGVAPVAAPPTVRAEPLPSADERARALDALRQARAQAARAQYRDALRS
jgi:hypothetical protein